MVCKWPCEWLVRSPNLAVGDPPQYVKYEASYGRHGKFILFVYLQQNLSPNMAWLNPKHVWCDEIEKYMGVLSNEKNECNEV